MGTWGTAIKSNDTSADTYDEFWELYNEGKNPDEIKNILLKQNHDDSNDFWFALALALWETKSLPKDLLEKVQEIVKSGSDIDLWREQEASEIDIKKRKVVLDKFLLKLQSERSRAKARKRKKNKQPFFETGTCLVFKHENDNYGAAIVLGSDLESGYGCNLILTTRLNQIEKPSIKDIETSNVLIKDFGDWEGQIAWTWFFPESFKNGLLEPIGKIKISKKYLLEQSLLNMGLSSNVSLIISAVKIQFDFEKSNGKSKTFPIKRLTGKNWWQIF